MRFDLKQPCDQCPFRAESSSFYLREGRAQGIAAAFDAGNSFQCHKTDASNAQQCGGALITLKREQGGFSGALAAAARFGIFDPKALAMDTPTLSLEEFVARHEESLSVRCPNCWAFNDADADVCESCEEDL